MYILLFEYWLLVVFCFVYSNLKPISDCNTYKKNSYRVICFASISQKQNIPIILVKNAQDTSAAPSLALVTQLAEDMRGFSPYASPSKA